MHISDCPFVRVGEPCSMKLQVIVELKLFSLLWHPHVLRCYGACSSPERPFLVLEKMETDLFQLLHDEGMGVMGE